MDDKPEECLGYLNFDLETSWRAHYEILSLNIYRVGAPDGSPVLNGREWGKISYNLLNNGQPNLFTFKSLAGHYFGKPSVQCIDPFVLQIIKEYATRVYPEAKEGNYLEYTVKKYRHTFMCGALFAPDWTHEPKFSLEKLDDGSVPF